MITITNNEFPVYQAFILSEFPRFAQVNKRLLTASRKTQWSFIRLFRTTRFLRLLSHVLVCSEHMDWLIKRRFGDVKWTIQQLNYSTNNDVIFIIPKKELKKWTKT